MAGYNGGILTNAFPLSSERIKELEREVIENRQAYAYLDENHELCFALPRGVYDIRELAWHNAYELFSENGTLNKIIYKKTGLRTYDLYATLTKQNIDDAWVGNNDVMPAGLYEPGAIALYQAGYRDSASAMKRASWDDLVANGVIAVSEGAELPEGAQFNEYGFYYGAEYSITNDGITIGFTFNEDGSVVYNTPEGLMELPAGTAVYSYRTIDMSAMVAIFVVSDDGTTITAEGMTFSIGDGLAKGTVYLPKSNIDNMSSTIDGDLVIVDGATGFEMCAFSGQTLLTGVMIPDSVTGLLLEEFEDCLNLTDVVLSKNLLRIGASSFQHCVGLRSIDIPNSVTYINNSAFSGCKGLVSIVIPDSATVIEHAAIADCTSLESVTIGNGVTRIGRQAFDGDSSLRNITFNGTMEQWNAIEKESYWRRSVPATYVQCSDGQVAL